MNAPFLLSISVFSFFITVSVFLVPFGSVCQIKLAIRQLLWCTYIYTVSQKIPTFKLSVTLSILTDFQNVCTAGTHMKFATKPICQYPPRHRYVAALPWKIKKSNFLLMWKKSKQIAFLIAYNFVIHPQILIPNKIFHVTVLLLIYFAINLWHWKFVTSDVTAVFVNNQHGIQ